MPRPSNRQRILDAALDQFHARGFHACSVDDITRAAGVPKGSLYNHFASKDALALQALREYQSRSIWRTIDDAADAPLTRLRRRFEAMRDALNANGFTRGCMVGNMASELADHNAELRAQVQDSLGFRSRVISELLMEAAERGELRPQHDPAVLGPFLVNAWEGVITRTKVDKDTTAMDGFFAVLDDLIGALVA